MARASLAGLILALGVVLSGVGCVRTRGLLLIIAFLEAGPLLVAELLAVVAVILARSPCSFRED